MTEKLADAYVAGLIDGEGCLTLYSRSHRGKTQLVPEIIIQMANRDVIEALHRQYGGRFRVVETQDGWKTQYRWVVSSREEIEAVLVDVMDYLIVKRKQAEVLIMYFALRTDRFNRYTSRSEEEWEALNECASRMRELNQKGQREPVVA